ncbi:MAG TPA: DUF2167 domain-containing protein [Saprospiraceae bacterium]|nr:DUF2167 domain-containing protein [Saprospiraceae bacterium]
MKQIMFILLFSFSVTISQAQDSLDANLQLEKMLQTMDSLLKYQTGTISLASGAVNLTVPKSFKFLDSKGSRYVLETLWGNPEDSAIEGMLFPENLGPLDSSSWAFVITYNKEGFVKDDDAKDIDYSDLLKTLQESTNESNKQRKEMNYPEIELIGWASEPYYNAESKALHWAKHLKFGTGEESSAVLNYDVRILGREGILSMNAVGGLEHLDNIKASIPEVIEAAKFAEGYRYSDFNDKTDKIAAYSIGGLIAGKVLAKAGFFAIIMKFFKVIVVAIGAGAAALWKFIRGNKEESQPMAVEEQKQDPQV